MCQYIPKEKCQEITTVASFSRIHELTWANSGTKTELTIFKICNSRSHHTEYLNRVLQAGKSLQFNSGQILLADMNAHWTIRNPDTVTECTSYHLFRDEDCAEQVSTVFERTHRCKSFILFATWLTNSPWIQSQSILPTLVNFCQIKWHHIQDKRQYSL
jgi:hypothetical protein